MEAEAPGAPKSPSSNEPVLESVILDKPLVRGDQVIAKVDVRKPMPVEMTGLSLRDIIDMDVTAMIRVLERTTTPALTAIELGQKLDPFDFLALASEASGFWLPRAAITASQPE